MDRPDAASPNLVHPLATLALPKPGSSELALVTTMGHPAPVSGVTFPDGRSMSVPGQVTSMAWSPDARWLAVATNPPPTPLSPSEWPRVWLLSPDVALPLWRAARTSVSWRAAASR